ncbi:MAG: bifunctional diaminohydroxyphosphoribosylaminopyrimidine deaminase/5-amino-6-(5-phosphoribosylamino)uracil reductase RibD [Gammaproteobacteria bacterium]|nr:bifunctional diaminohydroxyphosphoribosylaminopyrimidine deaminase/5-amino-6-(5-phosphoribosylamino)uracil reductase RibD [Gammaproteobacteria bacterium]
MARALQLAARGLNTTHPNPRVGCVIAEGASIIAEGWHERAGGPHAEAAALAQAGAAARGATAYVTLEPCCHTGRTPPCTGVLIAAGIGRVVYGAADPNPRVNGGGEQVLFKAGIKVEGGLLAAESEKLNAGFMLRMRRGWPLVRSKIAASIDGRTALASGQSQWLTGEAARGDVQRWRARSSAIMTGIGTVLADDPALTVRDAGQALPRQPLRVILDSRYRTPPAARVLAGPGDVLVIGAGSDVKRAALAAAGALVEIAPLDAGRVDLSAVLRRLGELEINEVWVEAGPALNGALLAAGLVDELVVYLAGNVLGNDARGMFDMAPLGSLEQRPEFRLQSVRRVGDDLRLVYTPAGPAGKSA